MDPNTRHLILRWLMGLQRNQQNGGQAPPSGGFNPNAERGDRHLIHNRINVEPKQHPRAPEPYHSTSPYSFDPMSHIARLLKQRREDTAVQANRRDQFRGYV